MRNCILLFTFFTLTFLSVSDARLINDDMNIGWISHRDLSEERYVELFLDYSSRGFMLIDVDAYYLNNELRYAMVWRQNTDQRGWVSYHILTSAEYSAKWEEYRDMGFRPLDVEAYMTGDGLRFAGIWVENKEGLAWSSMRNMNFSQYQQFLRDEASDGKRLVDFEAYETDAGMRYAAIFYENKDDIAWHHVYDETLDDFLSEVQVRHSGGFWVTDYESYDTPDGRRYAAIWTTWPAGRAYHFRIEMSELQFANVWRQYRDEGFRLIDFENIQTADGQQYAGIWIENNHRYRYEHKQALNEAIDLYRRDNDVPGLSVAIIHHGQMVYRAGFGFADVEAGKVAHGQTVYNSASVSKVIGGTLAAKLEDDGQLFDGTTVNLDLSLPTSDYLEGIPDHHTHQVDHLLAHIGCIPHYDTEPGIANQTTHYFNATTAAASIWDNPLVNACTIGLTRSYSTHGFTYVGAVLEEAAGYTISFLVDVEIGLRYNLGSMRVQWSIPFVLPANYERAVPYTSNLEPTTYSNSSWKVLGGGIEVDAVDLARFGWLTLNGNIVAPDARDDRMWSPVRVGCGTSTSGACNNGLAWGLGTHNGRRIVSHGGSWTGAGSNIRIYRDDGLVIALMSNLRGSDHSLSTLSSTIANIILTAVSVENVSDSAIPGDFQLRQNYPNPFNPSTTIEFGISEPTYVTLIVYDILGRKVTTLVDEYMSAGWFSRVFNAEHLGSGIYMYQLQAGDFIETKRLVLLR